MYGHVDDKREYGDMEDIRDRVTELRAMAENGPSESGRRGGPRSEG